MTDEALAFANRPPLARALELAEREVKQHDLSVAELDWLRSHPVTWLRALTTMKARVESHINKSRTGLEPLKPLPGTSPSVEYLRAKQETDRRNVARFHFLEVLVAQINEVKSLLGFDQAYMANDAEFVDSVQMAVHLIHAGKPDQAAGVLESLLHHVEERHSS